jgi:hypothetical protein
MVAISLLGTAETAKNAEKKMLGDLGVPGG